MNLRQGTFWDLEELSLLAKKSTKKALEERGLSEIIADSHIEEARYFVPSVSREDWDLLPEAIEKYHGRILYSDARENIKFVSEIIKNVFYWPYGNINTLGISLDKKSMLGDFLSKRTHYQSILQDFISLREEVLGLSKYEDYLDEQRLKELEKDYDNFSASASWYDTGPYEFDGNIVPPEEEEYEKDFPSDSDLCAPGERPWPVLIRYNEYQAILWLSKKLKYDFYDLVKIIERIRNGEVLYRTFYIPKSDGSKRMTQEPYKFLKDLQEKISLYILGEFIVNENVFGFSRGKIQKAIEPHLGAKSILCVDCENAFPMVKPEHVINMLTEGWGVWRFSDNRKKYHGKFSWYAAKIIADLTTCQDMLPQGAPTSPKIFDLVCAEMDRKLSTLAKNVKGNYTRYADNIYFSFHKEHFPTPIKRAILRIILGKRRHFEPKFFYHKLRIRVMENNSIRMLGLNAIDGRIHNTREYKRRARFLIHHLNWLLDHGADYESAWNKLQGLNSFAQKETWTEKLRGGYENIKRRIKELKI